MIDAKRNEITRRNEKKLRNFSIAKKYFVLRWLKLLVLLFFACKNCSNSPPPKKNFWSKGRQWLIQAPSTMFFFSPQEIAKTRSVKFNSPLEGDQSTINHQCLAQISGWWDPAGRFSHFLSFKGNWPKAEPSVPMDFNKGQYHSGLNIVYHKNCWISYPWIWAFVMWIIHCWRTTFDLGWAWALSPQWPVYLIPQRSAQFKLRPDRLGCTHQLLAVIKWKQQRFFKKIYFPTVNKIFGWKFRSTSQNIDIQSTSNNFRPMFFLSTKPQNNGNGCLHKKLDIEAISNSTCFLDKNIALEKFACK